MIVVCEAQWESSPMLAGHKSISIAGLVATVYNKGDYWTWHLADDDGRPLEDGTADNEEDATHAVELAILVAVAPKKQEANS